MFLTQQSLAAQSSQVFVEAQVQASSAPVSIDDFINDWEGSLTSSGDYAFADGRLRTGIALKGWEMAVEKRWHYDLRFSPDTAKLYYNIENKVADDQKYDLNLNVKMIHAEGISFAKTLQFNHLTIKPEFTFYRSDYYQLGQLTGSASGDIANKDNIAIEVDLNDYHFREDKILEDPRIGGDGYGISVNLTAAYENDQWLFYTRVDDLYSQWQFTDSVYLNGKVCVYFSGGSGNCTGGGGKSGVENYTDSLGHSLSSTVLYKPIGVSAHAYVHGRYQRVGLQKDWQTVAGKLGASIYSTQQLGLHWQSKWHRLALLLDHYEIKQAHHAQVDLAITIPW